MSVLRLRCKTESGTHPLKAALRSTSTVQELKEAIMEISGVESNEQKIMIGFPPKQLDLSDSLATLADLCIRSGDTFTIMNKVSNNQVKERSKISQPMMKRKEVPADNSCLFYSVFFGLRGYLSELNYVEAKLFRSDIANIVQSNPEKYTKAFLGKSPEDYAVWIQCDTSWGGGIELSILSNIYQIEIAAIDIQTLRADIYGQDENYPLRIYLLYDGIHYDPLFMDSIGSELPVETVFQSSDDVVLAKAIQVADEAKRAQQYTDTANFTLKCLSCGEKLTGQQAAQAHAQKTGHGNFGEIRWQCWTKITQKFFIIVNPNMTQIWSPCVIGVSCNENILLHLRYLYHLYLILV